MLDAYEALARIKRSLSISGTVHWELFLGLEQRSASPKELYDDRAFTLQYSPSTEIVFGHIICNLRFQTLPGDDSRRVHQSKPTAPCIRREDTYKELRQSCISSGSAKEGVIARSNICKACY